MYEEFGRRLKAVRAEARMSAREVAEATGGVVSRGMIANWESTDQDGRARKQSLDVVELLALAKALDVPPIALLYPRTEVDDIAAFSGYRDVQYRDVYAYIDARESVESLPSLPDSVREAMQEHTVKRFEQVKEAIYGEAEG